jgi:hypothetical protein
MLLGHQSRFSPLHAHVHGDNFARLGLSLCFFRSLFVCSVADFCNASFSVFFNLLVVMPFLGLAVNSDESRVTFLCLGDKKQNKFKRDLGIAFLICLRRRGRSTWTGWIIFSLFVSIIIWTTVATAKQSLDPFAGIRIHHHGTCLVSVTRCDLWRDSSAESRALWDLMKLTPTRIPT